MTPERLLDDLLGCYADLPPGAREFTWRLGNRRMQAEHRFGGLAAALSSDERARLEDLHSAHCALLAARRALAADAARTLGDSIVSRAHAKYYTDRARCVAVRFIRRAESRARATGAANWAIERLGYRFYIRLVRRAAPGASALAEPEELLPCSCGVLAASCSSPTAHHRRMTLTRFSLARFIRRGGLP